VVRFPFSYYITHIDGSKNKCKRTHAAWNRICINMEIYFIRKVATEKLTCDGIGINPLTGIETTKNVNFVFVWMEIET
jgi:hypothetical protein